MPLPQAAALPAAPAAPPAAFQPAPSVSVRTPRPKLRQWQEAHSVLDALFDWQFQRYVTPKVVKFFWIVAVLNAVLVMLSPLIWPALRLSAEAAAQSNGPTIELRAPPGTESVYRSGTQILAYVLVYGWLALMVAATLLWIRIVLESIIVVFDIAMCARSIDQTLRESAEG